MRAMRLVFLHGPAAAGKLTVARELGRVTGLPVFHNHLVVDALLEVFEFGSPEFVRLREEFWLSTFDACAAAGRSLIFTFAPEATVQPGFAERTAATVGGHGGRVHFVALLVTELEQERRIANEDRRAFHKLSDLETLRRIRASGTSGAADPPPAELTIDTDTTTPTAAAARVRDTFGIPDVVQSRGYPLPGRG